MQNRFVQSVRCICSISILLVSMLLVNGGCAKENRESENMVSTEDFTLKEENEYETGEHQQGTLEMLDGTEEESSIDESGDDESEDDESEDDESGDDESATEESRTEEIGTEESGTGGVNVEESGAESKSEEEMTQDSSASVNADEQDLVSSLKVAQKTNQLIIVSVKNGSTTLSMHQKNGDGTWDELLKTNAEIGKNGIGKTKEGDHKTPRGLYSMSLAFGIKDNPGTGLPYTKVDDSWYWVDDVNSMYYNQFVSTNLVAKDWNSAEHIVGSKKSYQYAIAIDYNKECIKNAGSAIFLHCKPTGGAGCIAVNEKELESILKVLQPGCYIIIDDEVNINQY